MVISYCQQTKIQIKTGCHTVVLHSTNFNRSCKIFKEPLQCNFKDYTAAKVSFPTTQSCSCNIAITDRKKLKSKRMGGGFKWHAIHPTFHEDSLGNLKYITDQITCGCTYRHNHMTVLQTYLNLAGGISTRS